jgi:(p)ppGpp synthase/HD superfamily hydrolase
VTLSTSFQLRQAADQVKAGYAFAVRAHGSQKYGTAPYSLHLRDVMEALKDLGFADDERLTIAALHDVLEDTAVSKSELRQRFGRVVAQAVDELSRKKDVPHEEYIAQMGALTFAVKLADRLANLRHNGRPMDLADLRHQQSRTLPKYLGEQSLLEARAKELGPPFDSAVLVVRSELRQAARRLERYSTDSLLEPERPLRVPR